MSDTHYFNEFFKNWTSERFRNENGESIYITKDKNETLHDEQKRLWKNVYDNIESLFHHPDCKEIELEKCNITRIALTPHSQQKDARILREEPWLYAFTNETDFFVIKFVVSPSNGIQVGIDYKEKNHPKKSGAAQFFHQYLQHLNPKHEFILKGSNAQEYKTYSNAQEALAAFQNSEIDKIEPCFIIPVDQGWDDEQYLNILRKKFRACMEFRQEIMATVGEFTMNGDSEGSVSAKPAYCFFSLADLRELTKDMDDTRTSAFFKPIMGIIKFRGAAYGDERLYIRRPGTKEEPCTDAQDLEAGLITLLLEKSFVERKPFLDSVESQEKSSTISINIRGEANAIKVQGGQAINYFLRRALALFFKQKNTADPQRLKLYFTPSPKKEKWDTLKEVSPELWDFLQQALKQKEAMPDFKKKEGQNGLPKLPRNRIFAGAPGTGKSWKLNQEAEDHFGENIVRVTFHPEYSYYDFVGSYRPKMSEEKDGRIVYGFVPGPFVKILKNALQNPTRPYCLIIEEINRARVAAVFGDIFQLLDRYSKDNPQKGHVAHVSEYPIEPSEELAEHLAGSLTDNKLRIPANLYIWATMNSADQGVFPMDTAFKRRWSFEYQPLNESKDVKDKWDNIRRGINKVLLEKHVNEDKLMGYYFLKEEERKDDEALQEALRGKVLMYLFDDAAKPFRKDIFKGTLLYSELRDNLKLEADDLGIFKDTVNPEMPETTGEQPNSGEDKGVSAADDENDSGEEQ